MISKRLFILAMVILFACNQENTTNSETDTINSISEKIEFDSASVESTDIIVSDSVSEESLDVILTDSVPEEIETIKNEHSFTTKQGKEINLIKIDQTTYDNFNAEEIDPKAYELDKSFKPEKKYGDTEFKGILSVSKYMVFYWEGYEEAGYILRKPDSDPAGIGLTNIIMNITDMPVETPDGKIIYQSSNDYSSGIIELFYPGDNIDIGRIQINRYSELRGLKYSEGTSYLKLFLGFENNLEKIEYFKIIHE